MKTKKKTRAEINKENGKKGGRPLKSFSPDEWSLLEKSVRILCTGEECAALLDRDYDTMNRAIKRKFNYGFAEYFKKHSPYGKASLRRKQFQVALSGNVGMLIWLGKQYLGQSEPKENPPELPPLPPDFDNMEAEALDKFIKQSK